MRSEERELEVLAAVGDGDAVVVDSFVDKWIHVEGTFVATLKIMGAMRGSAAPIELASVTAADVVEVKENVYSIYVRTDAYTSGSPSAILRGRESRSF